MAINPKFNTPTYSLENKSIKPQDGSRDTKYSSKNVLSKTDSVGERRAPDYTLERLKKTQ